MHAEDCYLNYYCAKVLSQKGVPSQYLSILIVLALTNCDYQLQINNFCSENSAQQSLFDFSSLQFPSSPLWLWCVAQGWGEIPEELDIVRGFAKPPTFNTAL